MTFLKIYLAFLAGFFTIVLLWLGYNLWWLYAFANAMGGN